MVKRLDLQIQEKRMREQSERIANEDYHRAVQQRLQDEEEKEKLKEEQKLKKRTEFKSNLLLQMGQIA